MHNRMPSRRKPAPDKAARPQGNTVPQQGQTESQEAVPRMPHERDESADSQRGGEPSGAQKARAAQQDVESGQRDTDKGPVMDRTYKKVREGAPDPQKKFSP